MAKHTKKARRFSRKSKESRRRRVQRGGGLQEEALQTLKDNGIITSTTASKKLDQELDDFLFHPQKFKRNEEGNYATETYGSFVFGKTRDRTPSYYLRAWKQSEDPPKFIETVLLYMFTDH